MRCALGMNYSILFVVHWLTDYGGLHENVFDTVAALRTVGCRCVVVAPRAAFNGRFRDIGAIVCEHDLADIESAVNACMRLGPYDLIHSHPFRARAVATRIAQSASVPMVLTIHGQYLDDLPSCIVRLICVSDRIADFIVAGTDFPRDRIIVIPNAVDPEMFQLGTTFPRRDEHTPVVVTVCSRMDPDKKVILKAVVDLLSQASEQESAIHLRLQGATFYGEVEDFRQRVRVLSSGSKSIVTELGWTSNRTELAQAFHESDLVIASGRAAAESIACGVPTIAAASRGYVGLVDSQSIDLGIATNFGGVLEESTTYSSHRLMADVRRHRYLSPAERSYIRRKMLAHNSTQVVNSLHLTLVRSLLGPRQGLAEAR